MGNKNKTRDIKSSLSLSTFGKIFQHNIFQIFICIYGGRLVADQGYCQKNPLRYFETYADIPVFVHKEPETHLKRFCRSS